MFRMIDIEDFQTCVRLASELGMDMDDFVDFVNNRLDPPYISIVLCKDCRYYQFSKQGLCTKWRSYNHWPGDFCSRGDDSSLIKS